MKPFIISFLMLLSAHQIFAQMDDFQRIALNVYVPEGDSLITIGGADESFLSVSRVLENRLESIVTNNGFTGGNRSPRFSLMPKISVLGKTVTSGAPTLHVYELELHLYVVDYLSRKKFASLTLPLKGADVSEQKAFLGAIKSVSNNGRVQRFLAESKQKILQYYNDQCDYILKEAETLASMKKHDEALMILTQVPQACQACYMKAVGLIPSYFINYYDRKCAEDIQHARVLWTGRSYETVLKKQEKEESEKDKNTAQDQNVLANAIGEEAKNTTMQETSVSKNQVPEALKYLVQILPDCKCYPEAQELIAEIKNSTHRFERREEDFLNLFFELERDKSKQNELAIKKGAELGVEMAKSNAEYWRAKQRDTNVSINKFD